MHLEGKWERKSNANDIERNDFVFHLNIPIINYRIFPVNFTENTEYAKIISTRKFWLCADFVVACFGHRQVGYAYILKVNAALILKWN